MGNLSKGQHRVSSWGFSVPGDSVLQGKELTVLWIWQEEGSSQRGRVWARAAAATPSLCFSKAVVTFPLHAEADESLLPKASTKKAGRLFRNVLKAFHILDYIS